MSSLRTFSIPLRITGTIRDRELARELIRAWRNDGHFEVSTDAALTLAAQQAFEGSRRFFGLPAQTKARCVNDLSYSGYVVSGKEVGAGEADMSEAFIICKDLPLTDTRVRAKWPCHGPVPWPDAQYRHSMAPFIEAVGLLAESLLSLTALGLNLPVNALTGLTQDGWHHLRVLRFPTGSPQTAQGIGAHTDYGLLAVAAQDEPVPRALTVFPGEILQFITSGYLLSAPHKVRLNAHKRFAIAYFHEPNFEAVARPLIERMSADRLIHYGTHFTNMFARRYPERAVTQRLHAEDRWSTLAAMRDVSVRGSVERRLLLA